MDKIKLKEILDRFDGDKNELYKSITFLDIKSNSFDNDEYNELIYKNMYIFHKLHGIENISSRYRVPILVDRNISYLEFKNYLNKLKEHKIQIDLLPNVRNHFDNVFRLSVNKLFWNGWNWLQISSSKMMGQNIEKFGKMYLSVDNKDLYRFANLLLEKCMELGLKDYEFKVNSNDKITRCDNVVIFFTKDNLNKYISIINQILTENFDIQLNQQNVLAYSVDDNIKIAKDYNNESYTDKICDTIIQLRQSGLTNEQIVELVSEQTQNHVNSILNLLDLGSNKKR